MEGNEEGEAGALIYWGSAQADTPFSSSTLLPGERSSGLALGDLNGDAIPEIVLANSRRVGAREFDQYEIVETVAIDSFVYQGSAQGYSPARKAHLPTRTPETARQSFLFSPSGKGRLE